MKILTDLKALEGKKIRRIVSLTTDGTGIVFDNGDFCIFVANRSFDYGESVELAKEYDDMDLLTMRLLDVTEYYLRKKEEAQIREADNEREERLVYERLQKKYGRLPNER